VVIGGRVSGGAVRGRVAAGSLVFVAWFAFFDAPSPLARFAGQASWHRLAPISQQCRRVRGAMGLRPNARARLHHEGRRLFIRRHVCSGAAARPGYDDDTGMQFMRWFRVLDKKSVTFDRMGAWCTEFSSGAGRRWICYRW
jgi:hypothetical protein